VELAASELDKTMVRAPIDGVVGRPLGAAGQFVKQGQQLLALVPTDMHVVANFKETQLGRIRPGQQVEIHVDAFPDQPVIGTVESFSPASGAQFSLLPAGERHRQLHQDRAARSRCASACRRAARSRIAAARPLRGGQHRHARRGRRGAGGGGQQACCSAPHRRAATDPRAARCPLFKAGLGLAIHHIGCTP
jgi:hypothetical protein